MSLPTPTLVIIHEDGEPSVEQLVQETYAAHYVMWNAGVEDTLTGVRRIMNAPLPGERYAIVAGRARDREFVFFVAPLVSEDRYRAFMEAWEGFAERQPRMTTAERDAVVAGTATLALRTQITAALAAKGLI